MAEKSVFGLDFPAELHERRTLKHVKPEWLEYETPLMTGKWWDYRFMNPCAATYLYAHHYVEQYRLAYRRYMDAKASKYVQPLKKFDLFLCPPHQIAAMWRGRQHADALGIPYDLYIQWAIDARMRYWHKQFMPHPNQLYSKMVTDQVGREWKNYLTGHIIHGTNDYFAVKNYRGEALQDAHHDWLFEQSTKFENVAWYLAELVEAGWLPLEKVTDRDGPEVAERLKVKHSETASP